MDARTNDTAAIDAAIGRALEEQRIVGAVVLIARDDNIVYRRAAGLADRERGTPMREHAVFRLASLTKPLVTAAALRMVELGRIALVDSVTKYLPGFRPALPNGETPEITLRHLLTHTAGLSYGFMQPPDGSYHRAGVSDGLAEPGLGNDRGAQPHHPRGPCLSAGRDMGLFGRDGRAGRCAGSRGRPKPRCRDDKICDRTAAAVVHPLRSDAGTASPARHGLRGRQAHPAAHSR